LVETQPNTFVNNVKGNASEEESGGAKGRKLRREGMIRRMNG
jgi:hypothetical protein